MTMRDKPGSGPEVFAPTMAGEARGHSAPIEIFTEFDARFHVRAELARGGMGRVVLAEDAVLRREVAIKELLEGSNAGLARRFEREALLTARLQHPGIVGVYEFARHRDGTAAIVMRRVRGRPFDDVIASASSLGARLALLAPFVSACDAVAYAHGEGVIHRDLKPANVLLGDFGDTVVIDWGLAKDLRRPGPSSSSASELEAATREPSATTSGAALTVAGTVMGTPAYMAPEQARGELADARSDVYALGAMLYQLLCGEPPYAGGESHAVLRSVLRGPPTPLVEREPMLPSDLVTIVERAMARDVAKRYASAGELAAELKRFQAGQLVASHRYSTSALLRRWVRRHVAVVVVSLVALGLLAGLGAFAIHRVAQESKLAQRSALATAWVNGFLVDMFVVHAPTEAARNTVTARSVLDRAADELDAQRNEKLAADPLAAASVFRALGQAYTNLGAKARATKLFERALDIRTRDPGATDRERLSSIDDLADMRIWEGKFSEAEKMLRDALAIETQRHLLDDPIGVSTSSLLSRVLFRQGRMAESEAQARATLAHVDPTDVHRIGYLSELANALSGQKHFADSVAIRKQILEIAERDLASGHPRLGYRDVIAAKLNLAAAAYHLQDYASAEQLELEVTAELERLLGPTHPDTISAFANLANSYAAQKKYAQAEALHRKLLAARQKLDGPTAPDTVLELYNLACTLALEGKTDEAVGLLKQAVDAGLPDGIDVTQDSDLASLHGIAAFEALAARRGGKKR